MALTEKTLATLPPGRHTDGHGTGLALLVRETGMRVWTQRLRIGGRTRELGHGAYPLVNLTTARRAAIEAKRAADQGIDPVAAKRAAKAEAGRGGTLREAVEGYLAANAPGWRSEKTARLFRARLERHAKGLLARPVGEVGLEDVHGVLAPIWTVKPETAQRVRMHIEQALEWAIAARWRSGPNPAVWKGTLRPLLAKPEALRAAKPTRHHPALAWSRVPAFLAELRDETGNAARALELAILTAARSGEARKARWENIDLDAAVWSMPVGSTKTGKAHRVPLSAAALKLLRDMLPANGGKPAEGLVFPGPKGAYSDMALLANIKRLDERSEKAGGPGWKDEHGERITPHGFRSSFRDWAGETEKDVMLAEMSLAHAVGGKVERAYARADLLDRRRKLMEQWAAVCEGRAEAEVVTLRAVA